MRPLPLNSSFSFFWNSEEIQDKKYVQVNIAQLIVGIVWDILYYKYVTMNYVTSEYNTITTNMNKPQKSVMLE